MSPSESITHRQAEAIGGVRRALADLERAVVTLRGSYGETLGVRRLHSDVRRIGDDLDELGEPRPETVPAQGQPLEVVPDDEYDPSLWAGAEDEGLGGTYR